MKSVLLILILCFSSLSYAKKSKVKFEYKRYERFDFEALNVEGDKSSPGDLSIGPRFKKRFKNQLPEKKDFNREMKKSN